MAFIGNTNTTQAFTPAIDYFSGTGSATAFTLSRPVASVAQVQVTIDNVAQNPSSAYTVSGSTITFTSAPLSGTNNIYVYYTSPITQVIAPGQGTVTTTSLSASLAVPSANVSGLATVATSGSATDLSTGTLPKARLPVGSVLQVVQMTTSTQTSNSSATFVSTGLSQAITPTSSTSKILILTYSPIRFGSSNGLQAGIRINKNSGTILMTDTLTNNVTAIVDLSYPISLSYLDSPATTSSTTYTIEFNTTTSASPFTYPTINYTGYPHLSTLTLMEIAG